jgi:hypothetical protein
MLPEENGTRHVDVARQLRQIHDHYWHAVASATGNGSSNEKLPEDVIAMTYHLAHRLQVTNERKQHWLEIDVATRIREMTAMLRSEIELLPHPSGDNPSSQSNLPWSWN